MNPSELEVGDGGGGGGRRRRHFEFVTSQQDNIRDTMTVPVNPMMYYVKQSLDRNRGDDDNHAPLQIAFADGTCGLALPFNSKSNNSQNESRERNFIGRVAVSSHPENSTESHLRQNNLIITFECLAFLNLVTSSILFAYAETIDGSKIGAKDGSSNISGSFEVVDANRSDSENAVFAFSIIVLFLGSYAAATRWSFGLSIYILCVMIIFICSMPNAPYFMYCFRYFFDLIMIYLAQQLKSHIVINYISVVNLPS
jgi:hypothetical protein